MKVGSVVLVKFPFTSLEQAKKRPALVMTSIRHSPHIHLLTLAMITSKLDGFEIEGDVKIKDWERAKLLHPSIVRLSKLTTIDRELIDGERGVLSSDDHKNVSKAFRKLYHHWVG